MADPLSEQLRAAGLRVTGPRLAVLQAVRGHPHIAAEEIEFAVRQRLGGLSTQAVYDILRAFTAAGLVRRIEPAGSPAVYESRVGDNHHHVVCRLCGAVTDVDCALGAAPCLDPASAHGYLVDEAEVTYWGLCPSCQQEGRGDPGDGDPGDGDPGDGDPGDGGNRGRRAAVPGS